MQVTSENFEQAIAQVHDALAECVFWAFDTEFTGLSLGNHTDALDHIDERYAKQAHGARTPRASLCGVIVPKMATDC